MDYSEVYVKRIRSLCKERGIAINKLATIMATEANIETLVKAKGFEECVAIINQDTANIVVSSEGLTPGEVAQIKEIVYEQAGIIPANIKIVEKK